ncbi:methyltransferase [Streptomyces maremycinicus]|nr:methyltransferase [Streptomyces sp. B9173]
MFDYDVELTRFHERLWQALDIRPGDHVLDIGCGTGRTTLDAARAASPGTALGIDVSGPMLALARERAATEGLAQVGFVQADAQSHAFRPEYFGLALSRFGTMFFSDPVLAFTNIGRALRPGARLVQLVWQAADRQEWHTAIGAALSDGDAPHPPGRPSPSTAPAADDPFTLADPRVVTEVLTAAGFTAVDVVDVREPVCYGPDADRARAAVLQLRMAKELLSGLDAAAAHRALGRLSATLGAHDTGDGVWFGARAWLVTARR